MMLATNLAAAAALAMSERGFLDVCAAFSARSLRRAHDLARLSRIGDDEILLGLDSDRPAAIERLSAGRVRDAMGSRLGRSGLDRVMRAYRTRAP